MSRLNKYIASSGLCSRRKADELIEQGKVFVNGKKVTELGFTVEDNAGYITTADDEKGRKTIYDLLPESMYHLKPVGRLDKDSTGLLILTNDGDLINELTHPSAKVPKVYLVTVDAKMHPHEFEQMALGIEIEPGKKAYADVTLLNMDNKHTELQIVLYQGMNRQIRKMIEHFGYEVKSLKRIQHATIQLEGLKRGEFKPVKPRQIKELRNFLNRISSHD